MNSLILASDINSSKILHIRSELARALHLRHVLTLHCIAHTANGIAETANDTENVIAIFSTQNTFEVNFGGIKAFFKTSRF